MPKAHNPVPLPHRARGRKGPPIVLLHGFGGDRLAFAGLLGPLSKWRRTIALDMPGHGEAAHWTPTPDATAAADAVAATLSALEIPRAVLIGHSLGGAVASIVALKHPDLVERLILLAPGGFGPEMNARILRHYAAARDEATLGIVVGEFFSPTASIPENLAKLSAEAKADDVVAASHAAMVEKITRGDGQGTLPLDKLAEGPVPVTLIWGTDDTILPVRQAHDAPAIFSRHILKEVGHMVHFEAPDLVLRIVAHTLGVREDG